MHFVNVAMCRPELRHRNAAVRLLCHSLRNAMHALRTARGSHA
jgi:hypothetical protein